MSGSPRDVALAGHEAELCVWPPKQDGSKQPETEYVPRSTLVELFGEDFVQGHYANQDGAYTWIHRQKLRPSRLELERLYDRGRAGVGFVCGAVSGNLELFEFDEMTAYVVFKRDAAVLGLEELVECIEAGYSSETPGGGVHWLYRYAEIAGNTKLARRPKRPEEMRDPNDKWQVLIETRGEGGYTVEAPSNGQVHPSGGQYRMLRGGVETIVTITPEERRVLHDLARTLNRERRVVFNDVVGEETGWEVRPGDDFAARVSWADVLSPHGWTAVHQRGEVTFWKRPGTDNRWSATTNYNGSDLLYVFSTSTEFDAERGYNKFSVYAILNHSGEVKAAARTLFEQGYGKRTEKSDDKSATGASGAPWPEPDRIWGPPPAPPLPIRSFPKEIADVAEDVAERQQAPIDFVAWPLVASSAGLIGRGAAIRPRAFDDWTERPCLWVACIAPPSWMKSPAILEGIRPLRRQQQLDHQDHLAAMLAWEQECAELKAANSKIRPSELPPAPVEQRCLAADATVEKLAMLMQPENARGLTLHRDELAGLILDMNKYRQKGGDLQFYLQAYTGGPYSVDRVTRESIFIPDLLLNLIGGIQPEVARTVFGTGPDDGFAARFTSVWPDLDPVYRTVDRWPNRTARTALDAVNDRLVAACWEQVLQLDDYQPAPFCRIAPEGQQWFSEWHEQFMTGLRAGGYPDARHTSRVGKYPGLAARFILVFHLFEWAAGRAADAGVVAAETVVRALDLVDDYVQPMERRVYAAYAVPAEAEGGRRIARWIRETRPARFTAREILRHDWAGLQKADEVAAALDWLVTRRWLREAQPEVRPGRPSSVYLVNPRLWEADRG